MRNPYAVFDNHVEIMLTRQDGTVYHTQIDKWDLPKVKQATSLYAQPKRNTIYVMCNFGSENGKTKKLFLHRYLTDAPRGYEVDHADGDGLNNRRSTNLKVVTNSQNQLNRQHKKKYPKSGVAGVYWFEITGRWKAQYWNGSKHVHVGYFDTVPEAEEAIEQHKGAHKA